MSLVLRRPTNEATVKNQVYPSMKPIQWSLTFDFHRCSRPSPTFDEQVSIDDARRSELSSILRDNNSREDVRPRLYSLVNSDDEHTEYSSSFWVNGWI